MKIDQIFEKFFSDKFDSVFGQNQRLEVEHISEQIFWQVGQIVPAEVDRFKFGQISETAGFDENDRISRKVDRSNRPTVRKKNVRIGLFEFGQSVPGEVEAPRSSWNPEFFVDGLKKGRHRFARIFN